MNEDVARFRIQAVSGLTGVSSATLRAWERRYGVPTPQRTGSAYRLYSSDDVELVRRMHAMVASGVAPSQAARELLVTSNREAVAPEALDPFATIVARLVEAARTMDVPALERELQRALVLASGVVAFERVLRPALVRIGDGWHEGSISVAGEHLASHLITTAALDLLRLTPVHADAPTALLACFAEEHHTLPMLGAALSFASLGVRPIVLGARTPPTAIESAVAALSPDMVGLSVTVLPEPASRARELVAGYADACGDTPWFVGGTAAHSLARLVTERGGRIVDGTTSAVEMELRRVLAERVRARTSPARARGPRRW